MATPVAYSVSLRGQAVELAPGHYWAELRSDGCDVLGARHAGLEGVATCRREFRIDGDGTFSAIGELGFADESTLTFRTEGRFAAGEHARRGTALGTVTGGRGPLAGANGYVVSTFLLWASGDLSEDHLGVLFVGAPGKETEP
jgi:hypothetical protein